MFEDSEGIVLKPSALASAELYANQDHMKPFYEAALNEDLPEAEHGKFTHASMSNNPHNLVSGPQCRSDDPGSNIDHGILQHQTQEYQEIFSRLNDQQNPNPILAFAELPRTQRGIWETVDERDDKKRYRASEVYFTFIQMTVRRPSFCPFWR